MHWHRLWTCICSPMRAVSGAGKRAPFLLLPGPAPIEPGRARARRTLARQPAGSLPNRPSEAERWLSIFGSVVATRDVTTCWRGSWVREAVRSLVSDSSATPRPEREAVGVGVRWGRRPVAKKGAAQMDRLGTHFRSLCWRGGGHSLRGEAASGRRCGKLGFRRDGELRDRPHSGRARTGEGSPDPSPPRTKQKSDEGKNPDASASHHKAETIV